jgi:hypothetical protein
MRRNDMACAPSGRARRTCRASLAQGERGPKTYACQPIKGEEYIKRIDYQTYLSIFSQGDLAIAAAVACPRHQLRRIGRA